MPYKDPIKNKEYYERHKKKYDADWRKKNRERWNEYQKKKAAERRKREEFKQWLKTEIASLKDWYVLSLIRRNAENKTLAQKKKEIAMLRIKKILKKLDNEK